MITRYLEKINLVPRITEKVSGRIPRLYPNPAEKNIILGGRTHCFYCPNKWTDSERCFDHVVPFNYIYQTEVFNIVAACSKCNSSKNDKLPSKEIFERVKERSGELFSRGLIREDYDNDWYQKLYDTCITDYHGTREFFNPLQNMTA